MKLESEVLGVTFQNPIMLAAGTCGFGQELADVVDLEALGGFVTKSVTVEPRAGNAPPRVAEVHGGMLNSIGLANPGLARARSEKLPWIRANVHRAQVLVSLAGHTVDDYLELVEGLDGADGFVGYELNLSCPNDARRGGPPFALDPEALTAVVTGARARTERVLVVKLAPNDPYLATTVRRATEAGADALTLVNTLPGTGMDPEHGGSALGAGQGGLSGPALKPAGLLAVRDARAATHLPILGVGGVLAAEDAVAYARSGASLVQIGTATFAAPRAAEGVVRGLHRWGRRHGVDAWTSLVAPAPTREAAWRA